MTSLGIDRTSYRSLLHVPHVEYTIVGALYVGKDLANLEELHVFHAVDHFFRLLAERIERTFLW